MLVFLSFFFIIVCIFTWFNFGGMWGSFSLGTTHKKKEREIKKIGKKQWLGYLIAAQLRVCGTGKRVGENNKETLSPPLFLDFYNNTKAGRKKKNKWPKDSIAISIDRNAHHLIAVAHNKQNMTNGIEAGEQRFMFRHRHHSIVRPMMLLLLHRFLLSSSFTNRR